MRMSKTVFSMKQTHNLGTFQSKILCKIFGQNKEKTSEECNKKP